jgi:uncharacterized protein (DUF433 family)
MDQHTRITIDPKQLGGVPCIRGLRIAVATIVGLLAEGRTPEQILADYPDLVKEDLSAALAFAAEAVSDRSYPLRAG